MRSLVLLRSEVDYMRKTVVQLGETISCNQLHNLNAMLARLHMKASAGCDKYKEPNMLTF